MADGVGEGKGMGEKGSTFFSLGPGLLVGDVLPMIEHVQSASTWSD